MSNIKIEIEAGITQAEAIAYIAQVIEEGRISECSTGPHYCWVTKFRDGTLVEMKRKRKANSADSFLVRREMA